MAAHGQPKTPTQPSRLGGYELLEQLGEGGMGAVWRARQVSLDRIVALKILPARLAADPKYIDSFLREARSAARLNHPNIVHVYDAGESDGVFYYAMELVNGETLFQWLKRDGALPETTVVDIASRVAAALKHAWAAEQLIHRDIKPDNVMIDTGGNVKLCDLGLAKNFGQNTLLSISGQAFGTPNYMSPEQARAERGVDCRSDMYSLGLTMYHAVTGQIPFHGGSAALVMARHVSEQLPDPRELGLEVSEGCCRVLQKLTAKNVSERYQTWDEVLADLERVRQGVPPLVNIAQDSSVRFLENVAADGRRQSVAAQKHRRVGASSTPRPKTQNRLPLIVAITAVLLIAAGIGGWFAITQNLKPKTNLPPPDQPPVTPGTPNGGTQPPVADAAAKRFGEILAFAEENPDDLESIVEQWETFLREFPNAAQASEARRHLDAAKSEHARWLAKEEQLQKERDETERRERERREAEERAQAAQLAKEAAALAAAEKAFVEFTKPFLESLAKRDDAAAQTLAQETALNPALTPLRENIEQCQQVAARLEKFWLELPKTLAPLKGKNLTVQGSTGVLTEIDDGNLVLERRIGDSDAVEIPVAVSSLTTDELLGLVEQTPSKSGEDTASRFAGLAWFCFAEGKADLANAYLKKAGGDLAPVQSLMTLLARGPIEIQADGILAQLRALVEKKQWTEAKARFDLLRTRYGETSVVKTANKEIAEIKNKIVTGLWFEQAAKAKPGTVVQTFLVDKNLSTAGVAISPDGQSVLASSNDAIRVWEVATGKETKIERRILSGSLWDSALFAPSGKMVSGRATDVGKSQIWDVATGRVIQTFKGRVLAIDPGAKYALVTPFPESGGGLYLFEVATGKAVRSFKEITSSVPNGCGAFSPDGNYVLAADTKDGIVRLWETATGKIVRSFAEKEWESGASTVAFSADGQRVLAGRLASPSQIVVWNAKSGERMRSFQVSPSTISAYSFSADGRVALALCPNRQVEI